MKKIIILFFILFQIIANSQIKNDTVYLYFNHKKDMSFKTTVFKDKEPFSYLYTYYFNDSLKNKLLISTNVDDLIGFDNKADIKWIDKKFMKKNDAKIYCIRKMQKIGYENVIKELHNCFIYLIDTKVKKGHKFKAREVRINFLEEM